MLSLFPPHNSSICFSIGKHGLDIINLDVMEEQAKGKQL